MTTLTIAQVDAFIEKALEDLQEQPLQYPKGAAKLLLYLFGEGLGSFLRTATDRQLWLTKTNIEVLSEQECQTKEETDLMKFCLEIITEKWSGIVPW
jgi:hypothetical protein